jgi:hypothetical protein
VPKGAPLMSRRCALCGKPITRADRANAHHPRPRSEGGTATVPVHERCHRAHHANNGDFARWGRQGGLLSSLDMHFLFTLKNVRSSPTTAAARSIVRLYINA